MERYRWQVGVFVVLLAAGAGAPNVEGRITRIEITEKESPTFDGMVFGDVGRYEKLRGKMYGEVDPADPVNAVIVNIEKAPRNARGMVEYVTNFLILNPWTCARGTERSSTRSTIGGIPGSGR